MGNKSSKWPPKFEGGNKGDKRKEKKKFSWRKGMTKL